MKKTVIVFDHETGEMVQMPLEAGGFLTITEPPMRLEERTDKANGEVILRLKLQSVPDSPEGLSFLENQPKDAEDE